MAPGASLLAALQLNHHGAVLLEKGDYEAACIVFCTALKIARAQNDIDAMGATSDDDDDASVVSTRTGASSSSTKTVETTRSSAADDSKRTTANHPDSSHAASSSCVTKAQEDEEEVSSDYIFRTPARVAIPVDGDCISMMAVSCAILFNLGLSQHLRAIESKDDKNTKRRLMAALQLYEMVYALQESGGTTSIGPHVTSDGQLPFLHILGLVNNCAQVHKLLNETARSDRLLQHLLASLMVAVVEDEVSADLEGFFAATLHLVLRQPCAARAA